MSTMKFFFLNIIFILSLMVTDAKLSNSFGECQATENERRDCIYLENYQNFYNSLRSSGIRNEVRTFLRQSQCGTKEKKLLICCTKETETTTKRISISGRRLLPQPGTCGNILSNRIVGGNKTKIDEFPWMALIELTNKKGEKKFDCAGSLINNRYVLTAAHCVPNGDWELTGVRLGEWDIAADIDCELDDQGDKHCALPPIDFPVEKIIIHPSYSVSNERKMNYDISLLRLSRNVIYTDFIRPICLPLDPKVRELNLDGMPMEVSGWGDHELLPGSNVKMKVTVPVVPLTECRSTYAKQMDIDETQLCAEETCSSRSGGPLNGIVGVDMKNRVQLYYYLAGIVSVGMKPCGSRFPGVYTKVSHFIEWIEENIKP